MADCRLFTLLLPIACLGLMVSIPGYGQSHDYGRSTDGSSYLFVWAGDADGQDSDFLAVVDVRRSEPTYGRVVATLPVGVRGTMPHHTEYEYPTNDTLFANGWVAGRTFLIDLRYPLKPSLVTQFEGLQGYSFPHSFARLPGGDVLATFQSYGDDYAPGGGLVEIDSRGRGVGSASARTTEADSSLIWPYSLVVVPEMDRAISTNADMGMPPWDQWTFHDTYHVQVWSVSDLRLVATVPLPRAPDGTHHIGPSEPRVLADGTVYVATFSCGLYRIDGLQSEHPEASFVFAFPGGVTSVNECSVPVVYGSYWIQTVPALPGLVALDVSDPDEPVEVSSLILPEQYPMPHWLAADRSSGRIVVTGDGGSWVLLVDFDDDSGAMKIDETFREPGATHAGIDFDRTHWPHGDTGAAIVHGALFGH